MTSNTNPQGKIPLDGNNNVPLGNLLALVVDDVVRAADSTELSNKYAPSEGRVGITADDTVYIGDGENWVDTSDIALKSVAVS